MSLKTYFYDDNKPLRLKIFFSICLLICFLSIPLDYYLDKQSKLVTAQVEAYEKRICYHPKPSEGGGFNEELSVPRISYQDPFSFTQVVVYADCEVATGYPWRVLPVNAIFTLRVMEHPFLSKVILAMPGQSFTSKIIFYSSGYPKIYLEAIESAALVFGSFFFMFYSEWGRRKLSKIFGNDLVEVAK